MSGELEIYLAVVHVGEVYETPNGRRFIVAGDDQNVVGMVCIFDPLVRPALGKCAADMFLKIGHGFAIVDKQDFFSLYKRVKHGQ